MGRPHAALCAFSSPMAVSFSPLRRCASRLSPVLLVLLALSSPASGRAPALPETPTCNATRLLDFLRHLRSFGAAGPQGGLGVSRPALSDADMGARRWLAGELELEGLETQIDGVGNVFARRKEHAHRAALLIGSHTDSVWEGGWLDGALGVAYAVEAVRTLGAAAPLEVVSFSDEEGRFGTLTGSPAFVGESVPWHRACGKLNVSLAELASAHGLGPGTPLRTLAGGAPLLGYLEAHIEQGPRLERSGRKVAAVEGIVGVQHWKILFEGEQNHAGSTAMADRRDAAAAALRVGARLNQAVEQAVGSDLAVWGVNMVKVEPNHHSVVAGHAELVMQYRATSAATLERMAAAVAEVVAAADGEGGVLARLERYQDHLPPVPFNESFVEQVARAAEARAPPAGGGAAERLWSWAFHDASAVAPVLPTAMLFIPSIGGKSHCFDEDTAVEDIALGCDVFAQSIANILRTVRGSEAGDSDEL